MMRKAYLKRSPRRRTPRKATPAPARAHMEYVASLPCLVSGERPVTLHHVSASIHGGRIARSHFLIVPLAARYHLIQHGPKTSVEALGHAGFYERYGINLLVAADLLWSDSPANPDNQRGE